jgi:hypothetical protein
MVGRLGCDAVKTANVGRVVKIDASSIDSWETFHSVFAEALGFPDFYGRNMDAWIDCLTHADDADAGMLRVTTAPGHVLTLLIQHGGSFSHRCPQQYAALIECFGAVNNRRVDNGEPPVLMLAFE